MPGASELPDRVACARAHSCAGAWDMGAGAAQAGAHASGVSVSAVGAGSSETSSSSPDAGVSEACAGACEAREAVSRCVGMAPMDGSPGSSYEYATVDADRVTD